ncbi:MAG: TetR family transcriptional regulator [Alphaproteobacteria bacterium]|nr:TetR family transcriptional regulator [Alphaproteobacteria bacterium]
MVKAVRKAPARKPQQDGEERWALPARQARSRATQARILEAAEKVFAEQGFAGARLADIAVAAKCSVGAVYFRFKDKDALFFAIAELFGAEVKTRIAALADSNGQEDRDTVIRDFVRSTAAMFRAHKGMFRAITECGFEHPTVMTSVFAVRDEMEAALQRAITGMFSPKDASLTVRVMTQMVYGFLFNGVLNQKAPARISDDRVIDELADAVLAYLKSKERH